MSWISNLSSTYDQCESLIGKVSGDDNSVILLPLFHLQLKAQLEIYIDQDGNFIRAERISKDDQVTVFPVTEDSASRGNGINPMPLFDKLCYIAGDYDQYSEDSKEKREYFDAYIKQLGAWANSEYSCSQIKAIYTYLKKEHVMQDLIADDKFDKDSLDDVARFIVESPDAMDEKVWEDSLVHDCFIAYTLSKTSDLGICYATGEVTQLTTKLPAKIRNAGDKAKLISSNDTSGYTFRGRFKNAEQAVGIGYVTSQKAHNALRWLISKQGYRNDTERIVCWASKTIKTLEPFDNPFTLFAEEKVEIDTLEKYAHQISCLLAGYRTKLSNEKVSIISVDTADGSNQGRLSITYYNELLGKEYLDRLNKWYLECNWRLHRKVDGEYVDYIGTPTPLDIARAAYGVDQEGLLKITNTKLQKKCVDRILSCIVDNRKLPMDILQCAVNNTSNPQKYSSYNWNFILETTCALIRKHNIDYKKGEYSEMLEEDKYRKDRDYLFGMLLAILDDIENSYYYHAQMDSRETNASKLWNIYSRYPARTFEEIRRKLQPYLAKTSKPIRENQSKRIEHILECLRDIDGFNNKPLNENYLLGYYCERAEIRKIRSNSKKEEE